MKNIGPIVIMHEEGITELQMKAVFAGIYELLDWARVRDQIPIEYLGVNQKEVHKKATQNNGRLEIYPISSYLKNGLEQAILDNRQNQLNGEIILGSMYFDHWSSHRPHYKILVIKQDIYTPDTAFVIGLAHRTFGTLISINRFLKIVDQKLQAECIKTETMHELGHVFGLINPNNSNRLEIDNDLDMHCSKKNKCVMRQGINVPDDWEDMTGDRLTRGALCQDCHQELIEFFA